MNHKMKKNIEDYEELKDELDFLIKDLTMKIVRIKDSVKFEEYRNVRQNPYYAKITFS